MWIDPPTPAETLAIIRGRLPEIERFYGVEISDEILQKTVDLTEEFLPGRAQPRKSIQLLDEVCAYCVTRIPPLSAVDHHALWEALEDTIGQQKRREGCTSSAGPPASVRRTRRFCWPRCWGEAGRRWSGWTATRCMPRVVMPARR